MRYHTQDHGYTSILFLKDDLTFHDIQELGTILYNAVRAANGALIVDMSGVGAMDITITGQFVAAHREARSQRREFVLANVQPPVLNTLVAGQVTNLVTVYDTTQTAIADLEEKAQGGIPRKFVPDIKCGHDDCVYYTYARYQDRITQACQYPFPEEIINGPTCRCYRMNWNQKKNDAQSIELPSLNAKKKSLYEFRDQVAQETKAVEQAHDAKPEGVHTRENQITEPAPVKQLVEKKKEPPLPATPDLPSDPFADDNFPSSQHPVKVATSPPANHVSSHVVKPTAAPPPALPPVVPPIERIEKNLTPEDTIRHFIEGWNEGRFSMEFRVLSRSSRMLSLEEYCQRRRTLQAQQVQTYGKITRQEIGKFETVKVSGDRAEVEITRVDHTPQGIHRYAQYFNLALEDGEWRIISSRQGEERRNSTQPQRARVTRADDFVGREQGLKKKEPAPH